MNSYLDHFVDGGHALRTTDTDVLSGAQDAFRVVARRVDESDDSYSFEHTAVTYVVDQRGSVVLEWPFGTTAAAMAEDLNLLFDMLEESAHRKEP